jgi:hypothetical protein
MSGCPRSRAMTVCGPAKPWPPVEVRFYDAKTHFHGIGRDRQE